MRTAQRSLRLLAILMTTSLFACEYPLEPSGEVTTAPAPADPALGISTTPRRPPPPPPIPAD